MFIYDKNKKYKATEDMTDIENYIGFRMPMMLRSGQTDEDIAKVSRFLYFMCVFNNVWNAKGATDCRTLPIRNGEFLFTALKGDEVLKQTTFII
jgi:hypothetical protein